MKTNIVLVIWACLHLCLAEVDFGSFQLKYNKKYQSSEATLRAQIYQSNLAKIEEHNKRYEQELETYKMGVNQFTDLTQDEFSSRLKTLPLDSKFLQTMGVHDSSRISADQLPERVDWRDALIVTPVKDEGNCGGSWAFSATGVLEGQLALYTGNRSDGLISLSEQQLLDCSAAGNQACATGTVQNAINYVINNSLSTEEEYPYGASQSTCTKKTVVVTAKGYTGIRMFNETDLKIAVATIGPISVALDATYLKSYSSGIFTGGTYCSDNVNHAVLVVGYGNTSAGVEYWIIKNSWGTTWGELGYLRMIIEGDRGICGIGRQACYPYGVTNSTTGGGGQADGANALWQNSVISLFGFLTVIIINLL